MKSSRGGCDACIVARLKERVNRLATASRAIPVIGFGSKQGALTGTPRRRLLALFFFISNTLLSFRAEDSKRDS